MIRISDIPAFEWSELYYQEFEIEVAIDALKKLIRNQESSWKEIKKEFDTTIANDEELNSYNSEYQRSYYSYYYERQEQTIDEVKRLQRNAALLSILAFFEGRLNEICQSIKIDSVLAKTSDRGRGNNDIERLCDYLRRICGVEITKAERFLDSIIIHKSIRNKVAHLDSYILERKVKDVNWIDGLIVKSSSSLHRIIIDDVVFLFNILDDIYHFFKIVLRAIDERYKVIKG